MNYIQVLKRCLQSVRTVGKGMYRIFYALPVISYKMHICPAINDFSLNLGFKYEPHSFYPAIMREDPKKVHKIYKRVVTFDEQGLPMLGQFQQKYWPVTIVQYGLLNYNLYLSYRSDEYKQRCLKVCEWLINNISDSGIWEHRVEYRCKVVDEVILPPWGSAMVQGEAISLLFRGYHLNNDKRYLECAEKALRPYYISVADGGILESFMGLPFYEEYPTKIPSMVLNGFMFSLFGLYDLSCIQGSHSEDAKRLFESGVDTLEKILPMYEGGYCSRYDLAYITAAPRQGHKDPLYHRIHVNQLIALNSIRRSKVFEHYIQEWK